MTQLPHIIPSLRIFNKMNATLSGSSFAILKDGTCQTLVDLDSEEQTYEYTAGAEKAIFNPNSNLMALSIIETPGSPEEAEIHIPDATDVGDGLDHRAAEHDANEGADAGAEPGAESGDQPGVEPGAEAGAEESTELGTEESVRAGAAQTATGTSDPTL